MSDPVDPTGGWAKATEETAKASQEAIQASRELAHFVSGPAGLVRSMIEDYLSVVWFKHRVRLWERVRQFCAERGMPGPTRKIPLNIGVPLLQNATLEEDDDLQDVWAKLLVNSADANSKIEPRRAFGSVLAEMSLLDVRNLSKIASAINALSGFEPELHKVWTYRLPEQGILLHAAEQHISNRHPSPEVLISLSNLDRLGCVRSVNPAGGGGYDLVTLTPFGGAFITACRT